jgi:broad specificity phosphatase PhoE
MDLDVLDVRAPLGWRLDGTPIWGYSGSDDGDDGDDSGGDEGDDDGDGEGGDGEKDPTARLQKALDAERAAARAAKKGLQPFTRLLRELGVKDADELRGLLASAKGKEGQDDEERRKADAAVLTKANKRIVSAEIRAVAANLFADTDDALRNLDPGDYEVDEDGEVDARSIERDLKDVLRRKPHLAKKGREPGFEPGARKTASGATDMSARIRDMAGRGRP